MKIVVFGVGGTGGVLGGYLADAGHDVSFIARGKHLEAMKAHGLTIHTKHRGDIVVPKVKAYAQDTYEDTPDILLICVKYYSIDDAIAFAHRVAKKETLVIPILNVFGTGAVMQEKLPGLTVLDGCMYVFAKIAAPGVIEQPQKILRVFYGFRKGQQVAENEICRAKTLEDSMRKAGIHAHFTNEIERDALVKFSFVSPMGATCLYFNCKSEGFQEEGAIRTMYVGLIKEIEALGKAMDIDFDRDLVAENLRLIDAFAPGLTTSMQRDVAAGRVSEFSGLVTRITALGRKYDVPTPLYDKIAAWGKAHGVK